jgi:hypothetical protein
MALKIASNVNKNTYGRLSCPHHNIAPVMNSSNTLNLFHAPAQGAVRPKKFFQMNSKKPICAASAVKR